MKRYFLIASFVLLTFASYSQSRDIKSQELIKKFLFQNLDDFNSYQSISFTSLDSLKSDGSDIPEYAEMSRIIDKALDSAGICNYKTKKELEDYYAGVHLSSKEVAALWNERAKQQLEIADEFRAKRKAFVATHKFPFIGWERFHVFRAKNRNGNYQRYEYKFHFDINMTKITDAIRIDE